MADDDSTVGAGKPASSLADKYLRMAVPTHDVTPGSTGNSFIQMGTFPVAGDPAAPAGAEKSLGLARAAGAMARSATGGQWSHTDGNRVTTTAGNVVDVIQGSYVAYRSSAHSPPGPALSCTWGESYLFQIGSESYPIGTNTPNPDGTITEAYADALPTTFPGDASSTNFPDTAGQTDVEFAAAFLVGPDDIPIWTASTHYNKDDVVQPSAYNGYLYTAANSGTSGNKEPTWNTGVNPTTQDGAAKTGVTWNSKLATPGQTTAQPYPTADPGVARGDVVYTTWGNRVLSYIGSKKNPVPFVYYPTYAGKMNTYTETSGDNVSNTFARGSAKVVYNTYTENGDNTSITEAKGSGNIVSTTTADGSGKIEYNVTTNGGLNVSNTTANGGLIQLNTYANKGANIVYETAGTNNVVSNTMAPHVFSSTEAAEITNVSVFLNNLNLAIGAVQENISIGGNFSLGVGLEVILNSRQNINAYHDYIFLTGTYMEGYRIKNLTGVTLNAMLVNSNSLFNNFTVAATNANYLCAAYDVTTTTARVLSDLFCCGQ